LKTGKFAVTIFTISILALGAIPFSTNVFATPQSDQIGSNPDIIPGQYIVILKDDVSPKDIIKKYGVSKIHQYKNAFNGLAISASDNQISVLKSDPRVAYIEPDSIVRASETTPPGIKRVGATQSTSLNPVDFSDVTIAILDTGIDLDHPDLNVDTALSKSFAKGGQNANDKHGHGTHVAGTAAAINNNFGVVGVAQNANLIAVKVLGNGGTGSTSDIIAGIDYVTSLNAGNSHKVDVINMSLGGPGSCGAYQEAIDSANKENITVVVAAGNESDDAGNHKPANCNDVITVSAIKDTDGEPGGDDSVSGEDKFASFSNYGDKIDISAPGVNVYSTYKDGSYATFSGTSMASPHVAGAAAVIIHNNNAPMSFDSVLFEIQNKGIEQTSDLSSQNGIDCSTDPDSNHEKLVYFNVTMGLESKGRWNHLLIPVTVIDTVTKAGVSNVCVDLDLDRVGNHWDFLGTTDSSGNIVFKLSRALDDTPYTATVINQSHFPSQNSDFTECKQIVNNDLAECTP
jgi:subtilisin family serine protease